MTSERHPQIRWIRLKRIVAWWSLLLLLTAIQLSPPKSAWPFKRENPNDEISSVQTSTTYPRPVNLNPKKMFRVLFTDFFFPNAYAKWRIEEVFSFVEEYYTDILTFRSELRGTFEFPIHYEEMKERFRLDSLYDILIFDANYNFLNKYNTEDFDGTIFNGNLPSPASYMLRRREFRNESNLDFNAYHAAYHLFLCMYNYVKRIHLPIPDSKHWIHLYPGGCNDNPTVALAHIPPEPGIVVTQNLIYNQIVRREMTNEVVMALGGAFLQADTPMVPKPLKLDKNQTVKVCFTQLAKDPASKGDNFFLEAVALFSQKYPDLRKQMMFYVAGLAAPSDLDIISLGVMTQQQLDEFYRDNVDIYISTETGNRWNGWPLGSEALLQGAVGITTDSRGMNDGGWNFTEDEIIIIPTGMEGVPFIVDALRKLVEDRALLNKMSIASQKKIFKLLDFDKSQGRVFSAIEDRIRDQGNDRWNTITQTLNS